MERWPPRAAEGIEDGLAPSLLLLERDLLGAFAFRPFLQSLAKRRQRDRLHARRQVLKGKEGDLVLVAVAHPFAGSLGGVRARRHRF